MNLDTKELLELFMATGSAEDPKSAEARTAFAAALTLPLNREIEKQNIARTVFMVDPLEPGAEAVYPKDIAPIDAYVLPRIGAAPQHLVGYEDLHVPCFEITESIEWPLRMARLGRIKIVQRKTLSLKNGITKKENEAAWALIRASVKADRTVTSSETSLTKAAYNEGFQMMESLDDYNVDLVLVNAKRAGDVRVWGSNDLDPTTMREIWRNAGVGNIWGGDIIKCNDVGDNEIYMIDTSRFGVMPVKQKFVTYDDPTAIRKFRQAVLGYEEIGMAVADPLAVVKIVLSSGSEA